MKTKIEKRTRKVIKTTPDDFAYFKRMITEIYPSGIVSLVSDTFDFWSVVNPDGGIVQRLKTEILARDGKVVIRPDSGDPVRIVCGYEESEIHRFDGKSYDHSPFASDRPAKELTELEVKGLIGCLWEIFGGTLSSTGYKMLDSHIGAIYGDSITLERAQEIVDRLERKGFASTNVVLGVGSYTYQYVTRDTHCFAVKSTYGEVDADGVRTPVEIFKDPKTDSGMKKSARGLTAVYRHLNGDYIMKDQATWQDVHNCAFRCVFDNGATPFVYTLAEVRANVLKH